jgi:hypothetical protein
VIRGDRELTAVIRTESGGIAPSRDGSRSLQTQRPATAATSTSDTDRRLVWDKSFDKLIGIDSKHHYIRNRPLANGRDTHDERHELRIVHDQSKEFQTTCSHGTGARSDHADVNIVGLCCVMSMRKSTHYRGHHNRLDIMDVNSRLASIRSNSFQHKVKSISPFLCPFPGYSPGVYCEVDTVFLASSQARRGCSTGINSLSVDFREPRRSPHPELCPVEQSYRKCCRISMLRRDVQKTSQMYPG